MNNKIYYLKDKVRNKHQYSLFADGRFDSAIYVYDDSGEQIFEPLHNKTVIAGGGLCLQKLFGLDSICLNNTPTYDEALDLMDKPEDGHYPTVAIRDNTPEHNIIGSIADETQRVILGFCFGNGGAGLEASDTFNVPYATWISPDNLVPFRYPLEAVDDVDETIYKGKKRIILNDGAQIRNAYYFKEFSNTPALIQNYVSTVGTYTDSIDANTVYTNTTLANKAQSYVELHLKLTYDDCREYAITHAGLEQAKVNQLSLVYGWRKRVARTTNTGTNYIEVYQDIRPFSLCHFPTELLCHREKGINIVYLLYA